MKNWVSLQVLVLLSLAFWKKVSTITKRMANNEKVSNKSPRGYLEGAYWVSGAPPMSGHEFP